MITHNLEQGSNEWLLMRLGKPTASQILNVYKAGRAKGSYSATRATYMMDLLAERLTGQSKAISGQALDWGTDNEPLACEAYENATFSTVEHTGFITDDNELYGYSPDGLVGDDGLIEIKCPFNSAVHIETVLSGKIKPEYMAQMQFGLWITGRSWCDFVSYDLRMLNKQIHIIRVEPDLKLFEVFERELPIFLAELAELESKFIF